MSDGFKEATDMYRALNDHFKPLGMKCDFGPDNKGGWWASTIPRGTSLNWTTTAGVLIEHDGHIHAVSTPAQAIEWVKENLQ